MKSKYAVVCLLCLVSTGLAWGIPVTSVSVADHGAKGDGQSDDTSAFLAALQVAAALPPGRTVSVPPGRYRVTATLPLAGVLLLGQVAGGWNADAESAPVLLVDHVQGPGLSLGEGGALHGFHIVHPARNPAEPTEGPPTILLAGGRPSVTNVKITNAWDGIVCAPGANTGRLHIANVFLVNVAHVGLDIHGTWDIPTVENVEIWNPVEYAQGHLTAFRFGHNDGMRARNLFAFRCRTAFEFYRSADGVFWGTLEGCSSDMTVTAFQVQDAAYLSIVGGYHLLHNNGLVIDASQARVAVTGGTYKTNAGPILRVNAVQQLSFSGVTAYRGMANEEKVAHLVLNGGTSIAVSGCTLGENAHGIYLGEQLRMAAITGNVFNNPGFVALVDNTTPEAVVVFQNNATVRQPPSPDY